eukprot:1835930-Amphidinium_carterae.1
MFLPEFMMPPPAQLVYSSVLPQWSTSECCHWDIGLALPCNTWGWSHLCPGTCTACDINSSQAAAQFRAAREHFHA